MQYHFNKALQKATKHKTLKTQSFGGFEVVNGGDLLKLKIPPQRDPVPGLISVGVTTIFGMPKGGKSRVVCGIAIAVANNGTFAGRKVGRKGRVLYFALEESEARVKARLMEFCGVGQTADLIDLVFRTKTTAAETLSAIRDWSLAYPDAAMVVIDVWSLFCRHGRVARTYDEEYRALHDIAEFSRTTGIAFIIVTHATKAFGRHGDFRAIAGTVAQLGSPDTIVMVSASGAQIDLNVISRMMPGTRESVRFDQETRAWVTVPGVETPSSATPVDNCTKVLALFKDNQQSLSTREIADGVFDGNANAAGAQLSRMVSAGKLSRVAKGNYALLA